MVTFAHLRYAPSGIAAITSSLQEPVDPGHADPALPGRREVDRVREETLYRLAWVIWELLVVDADELVEPGIGERTEPAITEMAGSLGCVFADCRDDDAIDGVPYYAWRVRLPQDAHRCRDEHGIPVAVAALHRYLRTQLPPQVDDWRFQALAEESYRHEFGRVLRELYDDLLQPLEVALLGMRRDGAQAFDPQARYWWGHEGEFAGTYNLWLCKDPDALGFQPWLMVDAGIVVTDDFWQGDLGRGLSRYVRPGGPVLLLPRPVSCRWLVTVTTGTSSSAAIHPQAVSTSYRWTSDDGAALAARVGADLAALFPFLSQGT